MGNVLSDEDIRNALDRMSIEDKFSLFLTTLNNECILEYLRIIENEFVRRLPEIAVDFKNTVDKFKSKVHEFERYSEITGET